MYKQKRAKTIKSTLSDQNAPEIKIPNGQNWENYALKYVSDFQFSIYCVAWCVWRGIKARQELGKREPPPPKSQGGVYFYYFSLAIFLKNTVV